MTVCSHGRSWLGEGGPGSAPGCPTVLPSEAAAADCRRSPPRPAGMPPRRTMRELRRSPGPCCRRSPSRMSCRWKHRRRIAGRSASACRRHFRPPGSCLWQRVGLASPWSPAPPRSPHSRQHRPHRRRSRWHRRSQPGPGPPAQPRVLPTKAGNASTVGGRSPWQEGSKPHDQDNSGTPFASSLRPLVTIAPWNCHHCLRSSRPRSSLTV